MIIHLPTIVSKIFSLHYRNKLYYFMNSFMAKNRHTTFIIISMIVVKWIVSPLIKIFNVIIKLDLYEVKVLII